MNHHSSSSISSQQSLSSASADDNGYRKRTHKQYLKMNSKFRRRRNSSDSLESAAKAYKRSFAKDNSDIGASSSDSGSNESSLEG